MRHFASPEFWACYHVLPKSVQQLADKNFALLKRDPQHPSLHFKKISRFRSVRVGLSYRALGVEVDDGILHRHLDLLSLPSLESLNVGGENADGAVETGASVADRWPRFHRW